MSTAIVIDAELIALGKQFEVVLEKHRLINAEHNGLFEEAREYAVSRTGWVAGEGNCTDEYLDELSKMQARNGFKEVDDKLMAVHRELDPIANRIMRIRARTAAGLRPKLIVAIFANGKLWDKRIGDLDWHERALRAAVEGACAIAGVELPRGDAPTPNEYPSEMRAGSAALN